MTNPLAGSNAELREQIAQIIARAYGGSLWPGLGVPGDYPTDDPDYAAADAILALLPTHPDTSGDRMRERAEYAPVDDDLIRAFIDGWNATLDHADFDMALHFWMKANCEAWPAETPKPDLRLVAPPQTEIADGTRP